MLAVIFVFLLDCIIGQVHGEVIKFIIIECVLLAGHPNIALLEAKALVLMRN